MEYSIREVAKIIGSKSNLLREDTITMLLTDSRTVSFPEQSLFFALRTKTNDGHKYIPELYKLRVRNFVVSEMPTSTDMYADANFRSEEHTSELQSQR